MPDEEISLSEAARISGVSPSTLQRWARARIIPLRRGRVTRYDRRHLERLGIDLEILALDLLAGQDVADQADQVLGGRFDGGELILAAGGV